MMNITKTSYGINHLHQPGGRDLAWTAENQIPIIEQDGLFFKDLERIGTLLPYEDWRLPAEVRAADLASRLTVEEIAGLMLYTPHQAVPPVPWMPFQGTFDGKPYDVATVAPSALSDEQRQFIVKEHIRHILLTVVQSARVSAEWSNALQRLAESQPHGIPVNISSDPRNGARNADDSAEFHTAGQSVSLWPEGVGFASCFDESVVRQFAEDASREYRALGITTALGPQVDLATEPRWMRYADTLGCNVEETIKMTRAYCDGMQTTPGEKDGWGMQSVNTMVKHWPGGGTGEGGRDAHYGFGKYNVFPAHRESAHLRPFTEGAFRLEGATGRAAAVMPYYSISWQLDRTEGKNVGNSYSHTIIHDMLREQYGYRGVVCTDWDITNDPDPDISAFGSRCYGVENLTVAERHLLAIENGVDQFGGNSDIAPVLEAYRIGCARHGEAAMRDRMEQSAARLLVNIFHCGLFENPYLDPEESAAIVGCNEFRRHGLAAQHRSVVLLKNRVDVLPLRKGIKVYVPTRHICNTKSFFRTDIPAHDVDPLPAGALDGYAQRVATPEEADVALVFVESPACNPYSPEDVAQGGNGYLPITLQYRPYTAHHARAYSLAGGDFREKSANRSYRGKTNTASNEQDLDIILSCRRAMPDKPVIVCATMNNPMVVNEFESAADGIVADFGVSRCAVLDILFGDAVAGGRLPFNIPKDMDTVEQHAEDASDDIAPHVDEVGNTYAYGFGLQLKGKMK